MKFINISASTPNTHPCGLASFLNAIINTMILLPSLTFTPALEDEFPGTGLPKHKHRSAQTGGHVCLTS